MTAAAASTVPGEDRWDLATTWSIAVSLVLTVSAIACLLNPDLMHWYVVPVTACGALVAVDAVAWARKRLDVFDPQALLGLFGCHFFYGAPLMHVWFDYWPAYVDPLSDWRSGLGVMAILNFGGLVLYRFVIGLRHLPARDSAFRTVDERRFLSIGAIAVTVGVIGFVAEVALFGGISGYLASASDNREALAGTGWILLVGESFPLLGFVVLLVRFRHALAARPRVLAAVIVLFAVTQFLVGGLRGSRSNTIWPLLIGLIVVHLAVRPVRRSAIAVLALAFLAFMYGYGIYKSAGTGIFKAADDRVAVAELSAETGRTLPAMLLGDLGRSDIQALVLRRQMDGTAPVAFGLTYVGAGGFLVFDSLRPEWMKSKVEVGTDMLYGQGAAAAGLRSSRIYGLAGEGTLNFGALGAVASFVGLGYFVRVARRRYAAAHNAGLAGQALCAVTCVSGILALGSDLDNMLWFLIKNALPLLAVLYLSRVSVKR